jgi:hypothetical protein
MAIGGKLGSLAQSALREDEFAYEFEDEYEEEGEWEGAFEATPLTAQQAQAELMAAVAARAQSTAEAEAMVGAATATALSPADRQALRNTLPHLVRGTAVLTRILRQNPTTRPAVRAIPTIVQRTASTLTRQAEAGQPITLRTTARVMANQTRQVLSSPRLCAAALQRNVRAARAATSRGTRPTPRATTRRSRTFSG